MTSRTKDTFSNLGNVSPVPLIQPEDTREESA